MRIVSLLPSATEILFAIGAGDDVVGVTHECDYPPQARALPRLTSSALPAEGSAAAIDRHVRASVHAGSSLYHLDSELLERLQPDLIVTQELCAVCAVSYEIVNRAARRLRSDPRIVSLEPSSLEDVLATIAFLGDLTGRLREAAAVTGSLRARIERLRHDGPRVRPRVALLEWTDPPMNAGHWIPALVELAGAHCVLGNPGAKSLVISWEDVASADPDAIVVAPCGFDLEKSQAAVDDLKRLKAWTSLRAYRDARVLVMDGNQYVSRPGPRLVDSAETIARFVRTISVA